MSPLKIADFVPMFDAGVIEWLPAAPEKSPVLINPTYCLMVSSANVLRTLLNENGVPVVGMLMRPPIEQGGGSPFQFNHGVPWFAFSKPEGSAENPGQEIIWRNAGILASYWNMPGVNGPAAILEAVKQDVMMPVGV